MDPVALIYGLSGLLVVATVLSIIVIRRGELSNLLFDIDESADSFSSSTSNRTPPSFRPK